MQKTKDDETFSGIQYSNYTKPSLAFKNRTLFMGTNLTDANKK